jgi:polyhydroxyalkanoate synthase
MFALASDPAPPGTKGSVLALTPRDALLTDGTATLYRFRAAGVTPKAGQPPVLLIPSMINRWYVLDLRPGASVAEALVNAGLDVYLLDWGIPEDEDRYLSWDLVLGRLRRMVRFVRRHSGHEQIGILGYCMGATLTGIFTALEPAMIKSFVNLAGPFDFSHGGLLRTMVHPDWFDPQAITAPGNLSPKQMQDGFTALRPSAQLAKWINLADRGSDPEVRASFDALETWAGDNIPFPAAAYVTYIRDLYQGNQLVKKEHYALGRHVDLSAITCPVLTVATDRDSICPLPAARALNDHVGSADKELFVVPGGHVGAVVGSKAKKVLYPKLVEWFRRTLWN